MARKASRKPRTSRHITDAQLKNIGKTLGVTFQLLEPGERKKRCYNYRTGYACKKTPTQEAVSYFFRIATCSDAYCRLKAALSAYRQANGL